MRFPLAFLTVAALGVLALAGNEARAQYGPRLPPAYGPGYRPGLSPYLNLLRGGDTAANYYLGVRPEFQRRADREAFRAATQELDERTNELQGEIEEDLAAGTPSDFGDTRGYFDSPGTYYPRVGLPRQAQRTQQGGRRTRGR